MLLIEIVQICTTPTRKHEVRGPSALQNLDIMQVGIDGLPLRGVQGFLLGGSRTAG